MWTLAVLFGIVLMMVIYAIMKMSQNESVATKSYLKETVKIGEKEYSKEYLIVQEIRNRLAYSEESCSDILRHFDIRRWEYDPVYHGSKWSWVAKFDSLLSRRHRKEALRFLNNIWWDLWISENEDVMSELYGEDDIIGG